MIKITKKGKGWHGEKQRHSEAAKKGAKKKQKKRINYLKGGVGDKLSKKDVDPKELEMGIKIEMEHTTNKKMERLAEIDKELESIPEKGRYNLGGKGIELLREKNRILAQQEQIQPSKKHSSKKMIRWTDEKKYYHARYRDPELLSDYYTLDTNKSEYIPENVLVRIGSSKKSGKQYIQAILVKNDVPEIEAKEIAIKTKRDLKEKSSRKLE